MSQLSTARRLCRAVVSLVLALCMQTAAADALLRNLEIQQCSDAELATWRDGKDRMAASGALTFSYRHAGSPRWLQGNQVLGLLKAFPEYRSSLPTACDIQRCRILNRIP